VDDVLPDHLLPDLLSLAVAATRSVSDLILSGFRSPDLAVEKKRDGSVVTRFDREAEQSIRTFLGRYQPHPWPVYGEEMGDEGRPSRYRWVVDPIDGTLPYTRGLPSFGTLLAFEDSLEQRSLLGVIHLHAHGEIYSAAQGLGAWCGEDRLQVAPPRPRNELLLSLALDRFAAAPAPIAPLPHLRCFADCYAHAMVARGAVDALAELRLARWDVAATEILIREAGGAVRITPTADSPGRYDCYIGSPTALPELLSLLRVMDS
jgi:histidinol-phosphatase